MDSSGRKELIKKGGFLLFFIFISVSGAIAFPWSGGWKVLEEAPSAEASRHEMWWLNAGGYMYLRGDAGKTIQGRIAEDSKWKSAYAVNNPEETEKGEYPQNIFRLVSKTTWVHPEQAVYFRVKRVSESRSRYRDGGNGLLLFSQYQNSQNLYYAGIRVDGKAVIKKKQAGVYQVLAETPLVVGERYDKVLHPLLLPKKQWIGVKTEVREGPDAVRIRLFVDRDGDGKWAQVLEAVDRDNPILGAGRVGIRSDFMDMEFKEYKVVEGGNA